MKHTPWLSLPLTIIGCLISLSTQAQVTPDGTTSTTVNQDGNNYTVEQGDRVGDNLFHSFNEFSVPTGGSAGFNNAADVANIFSRVTGANISSIDGLLSANGAANLYFINPNGIIFGENARLDLGGSFFASTADSLLFEGDAEFSAVDPQATPLLEISIPIGARFRDNPGDIVNRSFAPDEVNPSNFARLEVLPGENLTLVGGNINFESGIAFARGGNIELGGLSEAGTVAINDDGGLSFPDDVAKANISLSNFADVDVQSTGGGNITINAQNLSLESGELGRSFVKAGISSESASAEAQAGDITINVAENITLNNSSIFNDVNAGGIGNSGNITINAGSLEIVNGGLIDAFIFGRGDSGDISVNVGESVNIDADSTISNQIEAGANGNSGAINVSANNLNLTGGGRISGTITGNGNSGDIGINARETVSINGFGNEEIPSGVFNNVGSENSVGDAGNIQIDTSGLTLTNGGVVNSVTFGQGNAGKVAIDSTDSIFVDGEADDPFFNSSISSGVSGTGIGNAGGIEISTANLSVTNGGLINGRTGGNGNGGNINLQVDSLSLENDSRIVASTFNRGNAGNITINATDNILLDTFSGIGSEIGENAIGDSAGIDITTANLSLNRGSLISTNNLGAGNAGNININTTDNITLSRRSGIGSLVRENAVGNSGEVEINTNNLSLTEGSLVDTSSLGEGNAEKITINAAGNISVDGFNSVIFSEIDDNAQGNSEGIEITADNLSLTNGGQINSNSSGSGNSGKISINANNTVALDGSASRIASVILEGSIGTSEGINITTTNLSLTNGGSINSNSSGNGNAGDIELIARSLTLENEGVINSSTSGKGNGGNIAIDVVDSINLGNETQAESTSAIVADSFGASGTIVDRIESGNSGNIDIRSQSLSLESGSMISSTNPSIASFANAGNISINVGEINLSGESQDGSGSSIATDSSGAGTQGNIEIIGNSLSLKEGAEVSSNGFSETADGGSITIGIDDSIVLNGRSKNGDVSRIATNSIGNGDGGNISLQAQSLSLENGAELSSSVGSISFSSSLANGNGGNINLEIFGILSFDNNGTITAQAVESANGGNITIDAEDGFILAFPNGNNDIIANAEQGRGGNININTQAIFGLEERSSTPPNQTNDIDASSEFGLQGDFSLNTPDFDPTSGLIELPASVADASDQISQNPCQQGVGSEFIVTGKGGLPRNPSDSLGSNEIQVGLVEPLLRQGEGEKRRLGDEATDKPEEDVVIEAVPAMGWVFNNEGEVTLTAYSNTDTQKKRSEVMPSGLSPQQTSHSCSRS